MKENQKAQAGNRVEVHYKGTLVTGETFDSSQGKAPLEFVIGEGSVIQGFDDAVLLMRQGDKKMVQIAPENAYGSYHEELIMRVPRESFPAEISPYPGLQLQMQNEQGRQILLVVKEILPDEVILDGNHPLAGKELIFDIELVRILE